MVSPVTDRTLVVIPALDEADALPDVFARLAAAVPDLDVVVVDDGSTDDTGAVAAAAGHPVLRLPYNLGVGGALRTGFRYAVEQGYGRVVQFDGDGQHPEGAIDDLLAAVDDGADLAIGSRFAVGDGSDGGQTYPVGRVRGAAMGLLRFLVRRLTGQRLTDTTSGFRAFSRPMVEHFSVTYAAEYMSDTVEALVDAARSGYVVREVPVEMQVRRTGRPSTRSWRLAYHYVRLLVVLSASAPRRSGAGEREEAR